MNKERWLPGGDKYEAIKADAKWAMERSSIARSAPKATEIPSEAAAVEGFEGILTEEELKEFEKRKHDFGNWPIVDDLESVINSHRTLNERNRKLVFENDEQTAEIIELRRENAILNNKVMMYRHIKALEE